MAKCTVYLTHTIHGGCCITKMLWPPCPCRYHKPGKTCSLLCERGKEHGVFPFALGGFEPWLLAAWFDYLNLRINGLAFHLALLAGDISFIDERVTQVLEHWAQLIEGQCFNQNYAELHWRHVMTSLYRKIAVSTLIANFVDVNMPEQFQNDFTFQPFPQIKPDMPRYEDMPVDLFLIPAVSPRKQAAEKFLLFLARADVQHSIVNAMSQSSPHINALPSRGRFTKRNQGNIGTCGRVGTVF